MANETFIAGGIAESLWAAREFQIAANDLYDKGRLSPAYILATVAVEHVGRAVWLWTKGRNLGDSEAARRIRLDHSIGLKYGLQVISWSTPAGSPTLQVEDVQKVARRMPNKVNKLRKRAQYVEANGDAWNSPREAVRKDECHQLLMDVANSFGWVSANLREVLPLMKPELSVAMFRDVKELYPKPERDSM